MGTRQRRRLKKLAEFELKLPDWVFGHFDDLGDESEDLCVHEYDDEGKIYLENGELCDADEPTFRLIALPPEREELRREMFKVVNNLLRSGNSEFPHAKRTYQRLRLEGACNLEARALMATAWIAEMHECVTRKILSTERRLIARLDELHAGMCPE